MAEMDPPYFSESPVRALFLIVTETPPKLTDQEKWSPELNNFIDRCLQKEPEARATSAELCAVSFSL